MHTKSWSDNQTGREHMQKCKVSHKDVACPGVDWINLAKHRGQWCEHVRRTINLHTACKCNE